MPLVRARDRGWNSRFISVTFRRFAFKFWYRGRYRGVGLPQVFLRVDTSVGAGRILVRGGTMPEFPKLPAAGSSGCDAGEWGSMFPLLAGWVCDSSYPDGTPLGAVQLQIRRDGGVIRASLKVSDQGGLMLRGVGADPVSALLSLEVLLSSESCPWEKDPYPLAGARTPGKKK